MLFWWKELESNFFESLFCLLIIFRKSLKLFGFISQIWFNLIKESLKFINIAVPINWRLGVLALIVLNILLALLRNFLLNLALFLLLLLIIRFWRLVYLLFILCVHGCFSLFSMLNLVILLHNIRHLLLFTLLSLLLVLFGVTLSRHELLIVAHWLDFLPWL